MKVEQLCQSINAYFSQYPFFRVAAPLAVPVCLVCVAIRLLSNFFSFGGLVGALVYLLFFISLLLIFSACQFRMVAVCLGLYTVDYIYTFLYSLIRFRSVNYSVLVYVLFFGFLAFMAYRKSMKFN